MLCIAVLVCSLVLLTFSGDVTALPRWRRTGEGYAFTPESKNYITAQFQTINPRIEWDNALVALAGEITFCGAKEGRQFLTRDGQSFGGMIETTKGARSDSESVNGYVTNIVTRWMRAGSYDDQIRYAKRFGCSNLPACSGSVVVTCLFSPRVSFEFEEQADEPRPDVPDKEVIGKQTGLAFTEYQIQLAEKLLRAKWDRTNYLEDLSGFETRCAMIDDPNWPFIASRLKAKETGKGSNGLYGSERNTGDINLAVERILTSFKRIPDDSVVGCSVIPDCIRDRESYVVVSCLYYR